MCTKDEVYDYDVDGNKGVGRRLSCVDQSDNAANRLKPIFDVKIKVDHPIAGDGKQGATLQDCMLVVAVHDIEQKERTKRLTFQGDVLNVIGRMQMVPFEQPKGKEGK